MTPCELFEGCVDTSGYGLKRVGKKLWKAHRLAWFRVHGEIPEGLQVLHLCDVRRCVNVDHLFLGTLAENMADRNAKGRQARLQGERHGMHKLTDEQVREMRALHESSDVTFAKLGALYGVSTTTAHRIVDRRLWRHVA